MEDLALAVAVLAARPLGQVLLGVCQEVAGKPVEEGLRGQVAAGLHVLDVIGGEGGVAQPGHMGAVHIDDHLALGGAHPEGGGGHLEGPPGIVQVVCACRPKEATRTGNPGEVGTVGVGCVGQVVALAGVASRKVLGGVEPVLVCHAGTVALGSRAVVLGVDDPHALVCTALRHVGSKARALQDHALAQDDGGEARARQHVGQVGLARGRGGLPRSRRQDALCDHVPGVDVELLEGRVALEHLGEAGGGGHVGARMDRALGVRVARALEGLEAVVA